MSKPAKIALGVAGGYVGLLLLGGLAELVDDDGGSSYYSPPSTSTGTSTTSGDTASCRFLRASLSDFQAPNPGPTTSAEQTEYDAIRAQMSSEDC